MLELEIVDFIKNLESLEFNEIQKSPDGYWEHPQLIDYKRLLYEKTGIFPELLDENEFKKHGLKLIFKSIDDATDSEISPEAMEEYCNGGANILSHWNPEKPNKDCFLLAMFENDEGCAFVVWGEKINISHND